MKNIILSSLFITRDLSGYIKKISKFPNLLLREENFLLKNLSKKNDIRIIHKLILSHLKLVVKIAFKY